MKILFRAIPWLILLISFVILAFLYDSLPGEILIARSFFDGESITAQKTLFTVFRVPLIETVCAAIVEIMRRRSAATNARFSLMWNILLYTVSLKSLFQSLETVSTGNFESAFFYLTIAVVASGIIAALFVGRDFFSKSSRDAWKLNFADIALLILLLFSYFGLAIVPVLIYK
jgi:hypothetical protein